MADSSIIGKTADMMVSGQEVEERRTDFVCVLALVDTTASNAIALPVRDAFDPRMPTSEVRVVAASSERDLLAPTLPDVCIAVSGRRPEDLIPGICELAAAGVPVAIVAESALDVPPMPLGETALQRVSIISATTTEVLLDKLAEWLVEATNKGIAMAANFPFCRKAKVRKLTNDMAVETAMNRAKQGPGGELPSVAVSQARLALSIAAVNGQPLSLRRVPEVVSAIGVGVGSRMLANKYLGKIPVVGWLFEAGLGYLGTEATGKTLQHRFDRREAKAAKRAGEEVPASRKAIASGGIPAARRLVESTQVGVHPATSIVATRVSEPTIGRPRHMRPIVVEDVLDVPVERMEEEPVRETAPAKNDGVPLRSHAVCDVRLLTEDKGSGYILYGTGAGA